MNTPTDNTDSRLAKLISTVKNNNRMILRDDTIGAIWDKDENGKRILKRLTADRDDYWAITSQELAELERLAADRDKAVRAAKEEQIMQDFLAYSDMDIQVNVVIAVRDELLAQLQSDTPAGETPIT